MIHPDLLARARNAQTDGAILLDYTAIDGGHPDGYRQVRDRVGPEQRVWCFQLDAAYLDGDLEQLLKAGLVIHHPEWGYPFLWLQPARSTVPCGCEQNHD